MKPRMTQLETLTLQARLYEIIPKGHRNAIGLHDLVKRLGINERKIRIAIETIRNSPDVLVFGQKEIIKDKHGNKITLPAGYFFAETYEESMDFYYYMQSRVIEECHIMRSVKLAARNKFQRTMQLPLMPL